MIKNNFKSNFKKVFSKHGKNIRYVTIVPEVYDSREVVERKMKYLEENPIVQDRKPGMLYGWIILAIVFAVLVISSITIVY